MSVTTVRTAAVRGITAHRVAVEALVTPGLPSFTVIGVPDAPSRELRDRVRAAFLAVGWPWPLSRVTVHIPGRFPRCAGMDLAIAIAVAEAAGVDTGADLSGVFYGDLGLDGSVLAAGGESAVFCEHRYSGETVYVAAGMAAWVGLDGSVRPAVDVGRGAELTSLATLRTPCYERARWREPRPLFSCDRARELPDLAALVVVLAAARVHGIHYGRSQSDLAAAGLPIMGAAVTAADAVTVDLIRSCSGYGPPVEPFYAVRAPTYSATVGALVGTDSRPGEITLAYGGALVIDADGTSSAVLDALREPLRSGEAVIARAGRTVRWPARTTVIVAVSGKLPERYPTMVERWSRDIGAVDIGGALDRLAACTVWAAWRPMLVGAYPLAQYARMADDAGRAEPSQACTVALVRYAEAGRWSGGALARALRLAAALEAVIAAPTAAAEVAAAIVGY